MFRRLSFRIKETVYKLVMFRRLSFRIKETVYKLVMFRRLSGSKKLYTS